MSQDSGAAEPMVIKNPLVIMYETDGGVVCNIHRSTYTHRHYGLMICDLVRHVAAAFSVPEEAVWEWVDRERHHPTTDITRPS